MRAAARILLMVACILTAYASGLVVPQSLKAPRRQMGVAYRVSDVGVSEILLDYSQIGATLCQVVPAGVPEHVRMNIQGSKTRAHCQAFNHQLGTAGGELSATLRGKDELRRGRPFAFQLSQCSNFYPAQRMITGQTALLSAHVKDAVLEIEVRPDRAQRLTNSEAVSPHHQHKRVVTDAPAVFTCGFQQFFHFIFGQMFPRASPSTGN